jgi:hypothetical protein
MSHIALHPAPGLGEMLPGWFSVPNNPIKSGYEQAAYTPHVGELMPAKFSIPENPLVRALAGYGMGYCSAGMGGLGADAAVPSWWDTIVGALFPPAGVISAGQRVSANVGEAAEGTFGGLLPDVGQWPWYYWVGLIAGGTVLVWAMTPGGTEYAKKKRAAQREYKEKMGELRAGYRGTKRVMRSLAEPAASAL